jgi:hypothetical protein
MYKSEQALLSLIEPKTFAYSIKYEDWIKSMNEELDQIEKNQTWELVPRPKNKNVVGTKWIFKTKFNEDGQVVGHDVMVLALISNRVYDVGIHIDAKRSILWSSSLKLCI